jgi:hypothetical protein
MNDDPRVPRLAAALKARAREEWSGGVQEGWQQLTRDAFVDAGIPLTDGEFEAAWRRAWQCAFYGGNFTLDARRILRAVDGAAHAADLHV